MSTNTIRLHRALRALGERLRNTAECDEAGISPKIAEATFGGVGLTQ